MIEIADSVHTNATNLVGQTLFWWRMAIRKMKGNLFGTEWNWDPGLHLLSILVLEVITVTSCDFFLFFFPLILDSRFLFWLIVFNYLLIPSSDFLTFIRTSVFVIWSPRLRIFAPRSLFFLSGGLCWAQMRRQKTLRREERAWISSYVQALGELVESINQRILDTNMLFEQTDVFSQ